MRQFVLPPGWDGGPECLVGTREARHLLRVLRLGPGDRFPAVDAEGRRRLCTILSVEGGRLRLAVEEGGERGDRPLPDLRGGRPLPGEGASETASPAPPSPAATPLRIVLAAALLKGEKFDLVVRQAAEAGVALVIPLSTSRSLGQGGPGRRERLERVLREALQQSGSLVPTRLDPPATLAELPGRLGAARGRRLAIVLHEAPLVEEDLHGYLGDAPDELVFCVGPEGGFSAEEIGFLREEGFRPLRLPGAVLRAETAALFAVASAEIIHSERDSWIPVQA